MVYVDPRPAFKNEISGLLPHADEWLTRHACPLRPWGPSGRWDVEVDRRPKGAKGVRGCQRPEGRGLFDKLRAGDVPSHATLRAP